MKAIIFVNGDIRDYEKVRPYLTDADIIVCGDGGLRHAHNLSLFPDYILGDFDSVDPLLLDVYKSKGSEVTAFPSAKDFTDTELCFRFALSKGANQIIVFGAIGSRFDHSLGNVHVLAYGLKSGVSACIINEHNVIHLIDSSITLPGEPGDLLSLIPLTSEVTGLTTSGLFYPLSDATFTVGEARGVSNFYTESSATVSVKTGMLIIIKSVD